MPQGFSPVLWPFLALFPHLPRWAWKRQPEVVLTWKKGKQRSASFWDGKSFRFSSTFPRCVRVLYTYTSNSEWGWMDWSDQRCMNEEISLVEKKNPLAYLRPFRIHYPCILAWVILVSRNMLFAGWKMCLVFLHACLVDGRRPLKILGGRCAFSLFSLFSLSSLSLSSLSDEKSPFLGRSSYFLLALPSGLICSLPSLCDTHLNRRRSINYWGQTCSSSSLP